MKKWYLAILLAVLPVFAISLSSCNDDDNLPDVNISLDVENGVVSDGAIYVAQGDTIKIAGVSVANNDANKGAAVTNVTYYWDGLFYAPSIFYPYGMTFATTDNTPVGKHSIDITCTVLAVDKSVATATISYPVVVVASADELPSVAAPSNVVVATHLNK